MNLPMAFRMAFCVLGLAALVGCTKEPPGCADPATLSLLQDVFWNSVAEPAANPEDKKLLSWARSSFGVKVDTVRVTDKDEKVGRVACVGTVTVSLTDSGRASAPPIVKQSSSADVPFVSQLTADGKEHVVEARGLGPLVEYVWSVTTFTAMNPPQAKNQAAAAPEAVPSASAQPTSQTSAPQAATVAPQPAEPQPADPQALAESEFQAADAKLNQAYRDAMARLPDAGKAALRERQRAWIKERDAACSEAKIAADSGVVAGGSAMVTEQASCKARMTEKRAAEIMTVKG